MVETQRTIAWGKRIMRWILLLLPLALAGCPKNDGRDLTKPKKKSKPATLEVKPRTDAPDLGPGPTVIAQPDTSQPKPASLLEQYQKRLRVPLYPGARIVEKSSRLTPSGANLTLACDDPIRQVLTFYEGRLKRKATLTELPSGVRYSFPLSKDGNHAILIMQTPQVLLGEMGGRVMITIFRR